MANGRTSRASLGTGEAVGNEYLTDVVADLWTQDGATDLTLGDGPYSGTNVLAGTVSSCDINGSGQLVISNVNNDGSIEVPFATSGPSWADAPSFVLSGQLDFTGTAGLSNGDLFDFMVYSGPYTPANTDEYFGFRYEEAGVNDIQKSIRRLNQELGGASVVLSGQAGNIATTTELNFSIHADAERIQFLSDFNNTYVQVDTSIDILDRFFSKLDATGGRIVIRTKSTVGGGTAAVTVKQLKISSWGAKGPWG